MSSDWPLWEVFVRAKGGLSHRHVGSVHAPDGELALAHARDTYTRRLEGVSLWVVPSAEIVASDPDDAVAQIKPYIDAGLNHLVMHGPGHDQERFLTQFSEDVLPRLRRLASFFAAGLAGSRHFLLRAWPPAAAKPAAKIPCEPPKVVRSPE